MLLDSFNRWFNVSFNLSYRILQRSKFKDAVKRAQAPSSYTTLLQSFAISFGDTHIVRGSPFLFELLSTASQLESLYLDKFSPDFKLPFSQLHELNVRNLDRSVQILECLSMCHDLQETELSCLSLRHDDLDGATGIRLPKLHTFDLCLAACNTNGHHIFPYLNLPALRDFGILMDEARPQEEATLLSHSLQDLITRSGCQLTTLTLSTGLSDKDLVQILSLTPNLSHLDLGHLECRAVTNSFLEKMTLSHERSDAGHALVPHLTYLHILFDAFECEIPPASLPTPSLILAMVKSRRMLDRDSEGLQTFCLEAYHTSNGFSQLQNWVLSLIRDAEPGLRELEEDGLELDLYLDY
ncbi:hypothetical protein D9758_003383 [Tetrapyrgos nigripes]|uniref:Uncharacterized protein n=1 Tax=Tetrapyrgos nigripes TaxID=182062 RepID=A0A8H5LW67_9AGAR|nr:hypothetical protein D9758_003383 [Tetrapyrgos nigripes]